MVNEPDNTPPPLPSVASPAANPLPATGAPPTITALPPDAAKPAPKHHVLTLLLSLYLGLFVASGVASILDDSDVLLFGSHFLVTLNGLLGFLVLLLTLLIYGLMGLTPLIPKRIFLPVVFLVALPLLLSLPTAIFYYRRLVHMDLVVSCLEVLFGVGLILWLQRGRRFGWPLITDKQLGTRSFSWLNLGLFVLLNLLLLLPGVFLYAGSCASMAVNHFTDGFVSLHPSGIVMQARKYVRADGKTIVLFPMSHIAESDFYQNVARTVSSNSVVLLEGVTDSDHLLTNKLSYKRAAKTMHLAEQHEDFALNWGDLVQADVDINIFSTNTIALLNLVTRIHNQGLTPENLQQIMQYAPTEEMEQQLLDDLLLKRNAHVFQVLQARLPSANDFIIPWGAAHMPGLSHEVLKSGFRLVATHNFVAIRFGGKKSDEVSTNWVVSPAGSR